MPSKHDADIAEDIYAAAAGQLVDKLGADTSVTRVGRTSSRGGPVRYNDSRRVDKIQ